MRIPAGVVRQVEGVGERASAVTGELVLRRLRGVAVRVVRREEPVETVREDVRERPGTDGERELRHVRAAFAAARLEHARLAVVTATAPATRLGHLCDLASPAMAPTGLAARLCGARVAPAHRARELLPLPAALRPALLGRRAASRLGPLPRVRPLAAPAALRLHHLPGDPAALVSPTGLGRHGGLTRAAVPLAATRLGRHGGGFACLVPAALAPLRFGRDRHSLAGLVPAALAPLRFRCDGGLTRLVPATALRFRSHRSGLTRPTMTTGHLLLRELPGGRAMTLALHVFLFPWSGSRWAYDATRARRSCRRERLPSSSLTEVGETVVVEPHATR